MKCMLGARKQISSILQYETVCSDSSVLRDNIWGEYCVFYVVTFHMFIYVTQDMTPYATITLNVIAFFNHVFLSLYTLMIVLATCQVVCA